MLQVNKTESDGYTIYKFDNRGVAYDVLTTDGIEFIVYSRKKSLTGRTAPAVMNLSEMAKRSKALKHLAMLIA